MFSAGTTGFLPCVSPSDAPPGHILKDKYFSISNLCLCQLFDYPVGPKKSLGLAYSLQGGKGVGTRRHNVPGPLSLSQFCRLPIPPLLTHVLSRWWGGGGSCHSMANTADSASLPSVPIKHCEAIDHQVLHSTGC